LASADLSIEAARAAVVRYGQRLVADRLVYGSAGNLSIRIGDKVVMSPSGLNYDQITDEHVNVLSADGTILEGTGRRSSEWPMHRRVYDLTSGGSGGSSLRDSTAHAVIHTHSPFGVAVGTLWDEIPAVHYSVLRLGGPTVRVAGYTTFGSDGLAENVAAALEDRFACLLQNHGAVAYGADIEEAYDRVQLIEWMAEVYWRARLAGTPRILSGEELAAVSEAARQHRYHDRGRP
jgi:L-fuculose-phosphate aldolase